MYSRAFLAMALANFFVASSYGVFFLFPLFLLDSGGTAADIGIIMGVFALASTLGRPWIAGRIDRLGRKRAFTLGSAMMALLPLFYLLLLGELADFYLPLLLLRLLHGVALAFCFTAAFTYVADIIPDGRLGEGLGLFGISGLSGMAVGPMVGEAALHLLGFPGLFWSAALLGAIGLLLHLPAAESYRATDPRLRLPFFVLLRDRHFLIVALLALLFGFALAAPANFVAPLAAARGIPVVSLFFLAYTSAAVLTRLLGGRLTDRYGERRVIPYALLLTGGGMLLLPLAHHLPALTAVGFLTGCGHGFLFPAIGALAMRRQPAEIRGRITAIYTGAIDGGAFVGALLLGFIGEGAGLPALFTTAGLVLWLGLGALPLARWGQEKF
jgi:MFS family permease